MVDRVQVDERRTDPSQVHVLRWQGSDEELLARLHRGGNAAAALLYQRFALDVNRFVRRLLGPDMDHDDLVSEVFIKAIQGAHRVRSADKLKSWLLTIAAFTVRSELRKRSVRRRFVRVEKMAHQNTAETTDHEARELLERVFFILEKMPTAQRMAFSLRYVDGQKLEAVAELCDCSLATVKRRLAKADKCFMEHAKHDRDLWERFSRGQRWRGEQ